jgi:hypothetical protein
VLEPDGRTLLLDALRPPDGYRLDQAVATTFTLHLDTALSIPLSFVPSRLADPQDPIALMEAVRASADRLDVFHQAGMVAMPPAASPIFSFLEPVLHAVRRPKPGHLFHPKLWVLRYSGETPGDVRMRLIVPSRNLTGDRSWDLCLRLDGQLTEDRHEVNEPLAGLLRALPGMCLTPLSSDRADRLERLTEDLLHTQWELPEHVDELSFDVLGTGTPLPEDFFFGDNYVVISPFCTEAGLATVTDGYPAKVISRQESLDALPSDALERYEAFVLDPLTGEPEDPADNAAPLTHDLSGLHAKFYALTYNRRAWIRVGSANATDAAFNGNVELLVSLVGSAAKLGVASLLSADSPLRAILTEHVPQPCPEEDEAGRLDEILIDLASGAHTATVEPDDDCYRVRLTGPVTPALPDGARLTVRPVTLPGRSAEAAPGEPIAAAFDGVEVDQITGFVVLTITAPGSRPASAVVLAQLVGAPAHRLDEVIARQIGSPEQFLCFLALLLGMGQPPWALTAGQGGGAAGKDVTRIEAPGLFELLMRALVEHPQRLDDLARLVDRLSARADQGVLPDGFAEIWSVVDAVRRNEGVAA